MKTINLKNSDLDEISLSHFDPYLTPLYKISCRKGGYGFYDKSGVEHYSILAYLSTLYNNKIILDIGTFHGGSALALSYNQNNKVISVDIKYQVETNIDLPNIEFLEGNILSNNLINPETTTSISNINGPELIKSADLILYDTIHNGIIEKEFHNYLIKTNWKGICVWDDFKYRSNGQIRQGMQTFWNSIDNKQKVDITEYAHWTGTGLVWYGSEPKINLL
tara:strand:+ start:473 stop:1135 length:663 start_codon:yes stop_codon:yes gene_type:complete